ncbi:MAG: hypothetical protein WBQ72_08580 [Terriglobales bacterium]
MQITAYPPTPEIDRTGILRLFAQPAFRLRYFVAGSITFVLDVILCAIALAYGRYQLSFGQDCVLLGSIICLAFLWRRALQQHELLYKIQASLLRQSDREIGARSSFDIALCNSADLVNNALVAACIAVFCVLTVLLARIGHQISFALLIAILLVAAIINMSHGPGKRRYL